MNNVEYALDAAHDDGKLDDTEFLERQTRYRRGLSKNDASELCWALEGDGTEKCDNCQNGRWQGGDIGSGLVYSFG